MRKGFVLILMILLVLGSLSSGYASEEAVDPVNTMTLEQAKRLVCENSRNLKKYEISVDKTRYQLEQTKEQQEDVLDGYNTLSSRYERLEQEYASLQEKLDQGDTSVLDRMDEIRGQLDDLEEEMDGQAGKIDSSADSIEDAEDTYDDSVLEEENYRKQLEYIVEELYTAILNQEDSLLAAQKEYEIKQNYMNIERRRLQLGASNPLKVSEMDADLARLNKSMIELANNTRTKKGQLNDLMGRGYEDELKLIPFEVKATAEIPTYDQLLLYAMQAYDPLAQLERDIDKTEDNLDDEDDYYKSQLLRIDIKEKKLQLEDEKSNLSEAINNLITGVQSKEEEYQLALIDLKNAQRSYEWDKKRYDLGLLSKLALLESELNYLNMKDKEASSRYALYLAQRSLKLAEAGIVLN